MLVLLKILTKQLQFRDDLCQFGLPLAAWTDFRIIADWMSQGLPIRLIAMSNFILSKQYDDGSWSVDGFVPNSGSPSRSLELCALRGFGSSGKQIATRLDHLENALINGGLQSAGPIPGAPTEIGTTAVFSVPGHARPLVRRSNVSTRIWSGPANHRP